MSQRSGPCSQRVLICDFRLCRFYFCFYCSHLFQTCKLFLRFYAWSWCSEAPQCISFCEIQKAGNILVLKNCSLSFAILLFWWAYTLSLNLIFFYLKLKMNKWYCILLREMKLQQGQSITSTMLMLYPLCNYVLFTGTTAFTATQYCFKQQEQLRHQICLQTISHKLDSENQILYFSIYARWSCFAVGWSYWFYLFIFWLLKHRGFLSFKNGF